MLAASHEGEYFLYWATEDFTQVGQQSYIPKEPEDSIKLGCNTRQWMYGTHRNQSRKHALKISTHRLSIEIRSQEGRWKIISSVHFLQCWASVWRSSSHRVDCSQLSHSRKHSSHCFPHLLPSPQGPAVFILRSQCLCGHQLTGTACDFLFFFLCNFIF